MMKYYLMMFCVLVASIGMIENPVQAASHSSAMAVSLVITNTCTTQSTGTQTLNIEENCDSANTPVALQSNTTNLKSSTLQVQPDSYVIDNTAQTHENNIVTVVY
jgi:hypothetical protein